MVPDVKGGKESKPPGHRSHRIRCCYVGRIGEAARPCVRFCAEERPAEHDRSIKTFRCGRGSRAVQHGSRCIQRSLSLSLSFLKKKTRRLLRSLSSQETAAAAAHSDELEQAAAVAPCILRASTHQINYRAAAGWITWASSKDKIRPGPGPGPGPCLHPY